MPVVGIIAEYNPLHAGHTYHLKKAREMTQADACVIVLSSHFVQRGEPALVSKWARTKMALHSGADLVLELPSVFSCASAEYFASAAVKILDSLGIVTHLCFGSEEGNIAPLEAAASHLAFESEAFKAALKEGLHQGLSFASAREIAIQQEAQEVSHILGKPNNILGVEYIKALKRMGSTIRPVTISRKGQGYNSLVYAGSFSSASAIRKYMMEAGSGNSYISLFTDSISPFLRDNLPEASLTILADEIMQGRGPVTVQAFEGVLLYRLRTMPLHELARLPYMENGLENRIKQAALQSASYEELVAAVVTSRYPASRIRRILCALLMGLTHDFLQELKAGGYAQYIRVLGFNRTGRQLLSSVKKNMALPLITKPANYTQLTSELGKRLFEMEITAGDIYALGYPNRDLRKGGSEWKASPIYMED